MKIVIDLNGGDLSPVEVVEGLRIAVKRNYVLPQDVLAFGNDQALAYLKKFPELSLIESRLCLETIGMGDKVTVTDRKKDSSISLGLLAIKSGEANVFVSAGNTAAIVSLSVMILGRIRRGVLPAIAVILPSRFGHTLVIDVGANANADSHDLLNNAKMGSAYAREVLGLANPSVGLLNIGEELGKGHKDMQVAYDLLAQSDLNFFGYVEGNDIFKGTVDIVITDGFTGNIVLKSSEGLAKMILEMVRSEAKNNKLFYLALPFLFLAALFMYPLWKSLKTKLDYDEYGGALLLGIPGNVIISHGHAKRKTIAKAIKAAVREASLGITDLMSKELAN